MAATCRRLHSKTLFTIYHHATFLLYLCCLRTTDAQNVLCPSACSCLGSFVDCSRSKLVEIPQDIPVWVEILELQNNNIAHITQDAFKGLTHLKEIDLSHNQLTNVSITDFAHVPGLQQLKIQNNKLTSIPKIGVMVNLTVLSLHHNEIRSISPSLLLDFPNLKTLDLNNNKIGFLAEDTFHNNSKIQHLYLNNNKLTRLEKKCFDNLTSLETLKMNKNKLNHLPDDLFLHLRNLKTLELSKNNLTYIEGLTFKGLASLHVLKLKRNKMTTLRDGAFYGLEKIRLLALDHNNLTIVKKGWLYGLSSLEQMSLSHNQVANIEDNAWDLCRKLWELDLSYNSLMTIRKGTFAKLQSLQYLYLDNNTISYIEDEALVTLKLLEVLEMKNNAISWSIEDSNGAFVGLDRLTRLGLHSNQIRSIANRAFVGLGRLRELDLSNNPITSVQENAFEVVPFVQELRFNTTNLLCDCKLSWLPKWLIQTGFQHSVNARCGYPESLRMKSIFTLSPKDFTCDDYPKPYITEEPKTQVTLKGDNVTIVCKAESSSNSPVTYQWRKDYMLLMNANVENFAKTKDGDITEYTTILKLTKIQDQDEGLYQCIISNHFGSTYSQKARITVHVFPVFTKVPVDISVRAGSTATLDCAATGSPGPEIAWQKDGGNDFPAARERRMHVIPQDDRFFIVQVKSSDMGVYSCTATNVVGTIIVNVTITVLETPSFVKPMVDKETKVSETTVLECMASGSPKPELRWQKDGKQIGPSERRFFTVGNQLLIIVKTQEEDAGTYTCEMSNTLGTHKDSAVLAVIPFLANPVSTNFQDTSTTTGIIIIAVVCCVVGTSVVWVIIIYQSRKRHMEYNIAHSNDDANQPDELPPFPGPFHPVPAAFCGTGEDTNQMYLDSNSETSSKDSGTGDSAKRSNDDLLINGSKNLPNRHSIALGVCDKQYSVQPLVHPTAWPCRTRSADELLNSNGICNSDVPVSKASMAVEESWNHPASRNAIKQNHFSTFPRNTPTIVHHMPSTNIGHPLQAGQPSKELQNDSGTSFSTDYGDKMYLPQQNDYIHHVQQERSPSSSSSSCNNQWQPNRKHAPTEVIPCTVLPYNFETRNNQSNSAVS